MAINPNKEVVVQAIKGSIEKWKKLAEGELLPYGCTTCPLCVAFTMEGFIASPDCTNCPVKLKTKTVKCRNSPYEAYASARGEIEGIYNYNLSSITEIEKLHLAKLAQKEVEFLEKILVEYQQDILRR